LKVTKSDELTDNFILLDDLEQSDNLTIYR